jgi:hypothetical protein
MQEKLEKSPVEGHLLRVVHDFTSKEAQEQYNALKVAADNGKIAEAAMAAMAKALGAKTK